MNKKAYLIKIAVVFFLLLYLCRPAFSSETRGDRLLAEAGELENRHYFIAAIEKYDEARTFFLENKQFDSANECRRKIFSLSNILIDYPYTEEDIRKMLKEQFPAIPDEEKEKWIRDGMLDHKMIDGKVRYFSECLMNMNFRYPDVRERGLEIRKKYRHAVKMLLEIAENNPGAGKPIEAWKFYINPKKFMVIFSIEIPRKELPEKGLFKLWIPYPIQTDSQRDIELVSIAPEKNWVCGPRINDEIGSIYFEFPLEELKEDLNAEVKFVYTHYEQYFNVDPEKVGEYDRESELYRKYTCSEKNITITPEIEKMAMEIVGDEKNPYLQAKKIYDYILENIDYSYMPHLSMETLGDSESAYVHKHKFGDCGSQSMYFAALCRSLGIPARAIGGMQVWNPDGGSHFWAEFFLPNYGWIPVDTTIAEVAFLSDELSNDQVKIITEYFFGHQDPYRFIIQKNVDLPVYPSGDEPPLFYATFQTPRAECQTMDEIPTLKVAQYFKQKITPFN